jgi:gliding motility-associated-like protein
MKISLQIFFLLFCFTLPIQAQISNFDQNTEDWQANDDAQNDQVYWAPNFGNPAPSIFAIDDDTGQPWYFVAPPCFTGNRAYMYGKSLKYDLFTNDMQTNIAYKNDVIIFGANGLTLYHDHAYRPTVSEWTAFEVVFTENQWHKNNSTGPLATQTELQSVLNNIQELHILGEFKTGPDRAWLDNVYMGETPSETVSATICEGNTYQIGTFSHSATGQYTDILQSISGCDSAVVLLDLMVLPSIDTQLQNFLCDGSSIFLPDGTSTNIAGVFPFFYTSIDGCDSTVTVEVLLSNAYNTSESKQICQGETLTFPDGQVIFSAGVYDYLGTTVQGCDSNLTVTLTVLDTFFEQKTAISCEMYDYLLPDGTLATQSGSFIYRLKNTAGCDSTLRIDLTLLPSFDTQLQYYLCDGSSILLPDGTTTNIAGVFPFFYTTIDGCDSTVTVEVLASNAYNISESKQICQGETLTFPDGQVIFSAGVYDYLGTTVQGCDSNLTVTLTVLDTFFEQKTASFCEMSDYLLPDGTLATQSGSFIYRLKNAAGCDSTLRIDLTRLDSVLVAKQKNICFKDIFYLPDGTLATESGVFTYVSARNNGCDSTFMLDLRISFAADTTLDVIISEGDFYKLPDGTVIRDSNLVKNYFLETTQGCDSVVHLRLRTIFQKVFIPNAFSPNGDGINDFFSIFANEDTKIIQQLNIYDRWGELIFIKKDFAPNQESLGWDGTFREKKAMPGVYTYWAEVEFLDGKKKFFKGDVTLID